MSVATKKARAEMPVTVPIEGADAETVQRVSQAILEAVFSKTATPAAGAPPRPDQESFTVRVPKLDPDERREIREKANWLHEELRAALKPELARLVFQYGEACRKDEIVSELNMLDMLVEALAAHLPGQAPLIRCLAQHILDTDFSMSSECGFIESPYRPRPTSGADE